MFLNNYIMFFFLNAMIKNIKLINLMGLRCPLPVLKIAKKIKEIKKGDIIKVKVDDPKAENDINELKKQIKIKIIKKIKHNDFMLFEIEKN
ncbi:MAG: hypothetical protein CMP38_06405 [Rickettsiales bacterium]|nr:hypothetical protein [Rickettsiales bacterium]